MVNIPDTIISGSNIHRDTGSIGFHEITLPHDSVATEWWYVNGHLHVDGGDPLSPPPFSFYASFLKVRLDSRKGPAGVFTWAIVDTRDKENGRYYTDSVLDLQARAGLEVALKAGHYKMDKTLKSALVDLLRKEILPGPDRSIPTSAKFSKAPPLVLDFGGESQFTHDATTGKYRLKCQHLQQNMMLDVEFTPQREPTRQKLNEDIMKVVIPKMTISGKLSVPSLTDKGVKNTFETSGSGWYEHGFGGEPVLRLEKQKITHFAHWFSLQLSNEMEISVTHLVDPVTGKNAENSGFISSDALYKHCSDLVVQDLSQKDRWMSVRSALSYSTKWKILIPSANVDLLVEAAMDSQEFISYTKVPALWEGRVHVTGNVNGIPVTGIGFLEMNAALETPTLLEFREKFTDKVLQQAEKVLPINPSSSDISNILDMPPHYLDGLRADTVVQTIIKPLREMVAQGRTCWHAFLIMVGIDCLGGDSNKFQDLMVVLTVLEAAILILDDIVDRSELRRGGPACHKVYGEPIALTAGMHALFFAVNIVMKRKDMPPEVQLEFYNKCFLCMSSVFVGQSLDAAGFEALMPEVIESGDPAHLLTHISNCYKMKTAVPASISASLGAVVAGIAPQDVAILVKYLEKFAFPCQLLDDVLDLRGNANKSKTVGEDITEGKITYPIAMAMSSKFVPSKEARQSIFDRIKSRPNPPLYKKKMLEIQKKIDLSKENGDDNLKTLEEEYEKNKKLFQQNEETLIGLLKELEACGAIEETIQIAKRHFEEARQEADKLPDNRYKVAMLAFVESATELQTILI